MHSFVRESLLSSQLSANSCVTDIMNLISRIGLYLSLASHIIKFLSFCVYNQASIMMLLSVCSKVWWEKCPHLFAAGLNAYRIPTASGKGSSCKVVGCYFSQSHSLMVVSYEDGEARLHHFPDGTLSGRASLSCLGMRCVNTLLWVDWTIICCCTSDGNQFMLSR